MQTTSARIIAIFEDKEKASELVSLHAVANSTETSSPSRPMRSGIQSLCTNLTGQPDGQNQLGNVKQPLTSIRSSPKQIR